MSTHMHALYRPVLQLYKCPPMKGYVHVACFACTCVSVCVPRDIKQPYCLIGVGHLGGMSHLQDYPYLIQRPVSLSEVSHKLDAQEYGSPKDFTDDLVLIVKNSEVYNTDIRSLVSCCTTSVVI